MFAEKKSPTKEVPKKASGKAVTAAMELVLFDRVAEIIDQARSNVVRALNNNMVLAYWLIGREIVRDLQGGKERAAYGRQVFWDLSWKLTERYGAGFSGTNLNHFRTFYLIYQIRHPLGDEWRTVASLAANPRPVGVESASPPPVTTSQSIRHPWSDELRMSEPNLTIQRPTGAEWALPEKSYPVGSQSVPAFSPQLSWSHYRAPSGVPANRQRWICWPAGGNLECGRLASAFASGACPAAGSRRIPFRRRNPAGKRQQAACGKAEASRPHSKMPSASPFPAKYSVLKDRRQIFASKYTLFLPTEEELRREIERERRLIEDRMPTKLPATPDHR